MRKLFLVLVIVTTIGSVGFSQSHKYYVENGIVTASQVGSGNFFLKIDTKKGEQQLHFTYSKMERDMYVYNLVKVDKEILTEYQKSISYLKTRTKFSDLCAGKGGDLLIKVLGESELVTLESK